MGLLAQAGDSAPAMRAADVEAHAALVYDVKALKIEKGEDDPA